MMVSMEVYLRRGQRRMQRVMLDPRVREVGTVTLWWSGGFLLSAASLLGYAQPLAVGLICAGAGWKAFVMALGAMMGYPLFWGLAGGQGLVWAAAAGLFAVMTGHREERHEVPLMAPSVTAFLVAVTELVFRLFLEDTTPLNVILLRIILTFFSGVLFTQSFYCRDAVTDWLVCGVGILALARVGHLGYIAAGLLSVYGAFPAAVLAGLGLDLAQVSQVPMTAVLAAAYFVRMIPFEKRWQTYAAPVGAYLAVMLLCGVRSLQPVPGLALGGAIASLLPPKPRLYHRRGGTGVAQVRLELGAEVLGAVQRTLLEMEPPPIDGYALLDKARDRACSTCAVRRTCTQKDALDLSHLESPLDADCRKPGRLIPELHRAKEQLRSLKAERRRQQEYRVALQQQYGFLGNYLRSLSDSLPRRASEQEAEFRVEISVRSRGKEKANGDRCVAFPGPGCRYYVLLCDGMGTGIGAAQEGVNAMKLLRQILCAGFPAEYALGTYNSLLALRGAAGAVTIDLAEIHLDTGQALVYKWGAAPSWMLYRNRIRKIGTASPPPGIMVSGAREKVEKLSLCRGEMLILLSDGLNGEDVLGHNSFSSDMPPGELAAKILDAGGGAGEDDATVASIRLRPTGLVPS